MSILELFIVAVGLSMDAFAIAVCLGLSKKPSIKSMLIIGLYFGVFQALMPVLGYFLGSILTGLINDIDHWVAFAVLVYLGARMIISGVRGGEGVDKSLDNSAKALSPAKMLPLAVATSIDALAIGVTFALMNVNISFSALIIGTVTFTLSAVGVWFGGVFGSRIGSRAEIAGGAALVALGVKMLVSGL